MGRIKEFFEAEILAMALERQTMLPLPIVNLNLKPVTKAEYWEAVLAQKQEAAHA